MPNLRNKYSHKPHPKYITKAADGSTNCKTDAIAIIDLEGRRIKMCFKMGENIFNITTDKYIISRPRNNSLSQLHVV